MDPVTLIAAAALALVLFLAIRYIVKEKRKGSKCISCPYAGECAAARLLAEEACIQKNIKL